MSPKSIVDGSSVHTFPEHRNVPMGVYARRYQTCGPGRSGSLRLMRYLFEDFVGGLMEVVHALGQLLHHLDQPLGVGLRQQEVLDVREPPLIQQAPQNHFPADFAASPRIERPKSLSPLVTSAVISV